MRDYMDRRVTPPKRVTSPTWGPPPPCKQALRLRQEMTVGKVVQKAPARCNQSGRSCLSM